MRILGITLPEEKRIDIALTAIYGIGRPRAKKILIDAKVDPGKRPADVTTAEENGIRAIVETLKLEGDLKREISQNIKRLKDIKTYRGTRHAKNLPSRGQRTKTNSRTRRGNTRKTMGTGRKAADKK